MAVIDCTLPQVFLRREGDAIHIVAQSEGVTEEVLAELQRACLAFGQPSIVFPSAMFTQRWKKQYLIVVQVIDAPLRFHAVIVDENALSFAAIDPELIAKDIRPDWNASGTIEPFVWKSEYPVDTIAVFQDILKTGNSQLLLGATQALFDSGKIVFERPDPDPMLVRNLWRMLPYSSRRELTFATFAFSDALRCNVMVMPKIEAVPVGYLIESNVLDYPEGRYEKAVQIAVEADDQRGLNRLLWRRSSSETLRLAWWILGASMLVAIVMKIMFGNPVKIG